MARSKTDADKAFKDTFKKSGGRAAMAARKKARRDAAAKPKTKPKTKTETTATVTKPKNEKMNAETAATGKAAPNNTGKNFRFFNAGTGTKGTKPPKTETMSRITAATGNADPNNTGKNFRTFNAGTGTGTKGTNPSIFAPGKPIKRNTGITDKIKNAFGRFSKTLEDNKSSNNPVEKNKNKSTLMAPGQNKNNSLRNSLKSFNKTLEDNKSSNNRKSLVKKNMGGKIRGYGLARGGKVVKSS